MINKILVANRGEIAARIMRTAHRLGIETVAVFSDADRDAPHVGLATEAVHIGPSPATQSYLNVPKIIAAAQDTGAQAVHPGYGFLSENADFAAACAAAGLIFIGPSADVIRLMGSKREAKALMAAHDVPVVPGYDGAGDDAALLDAAQAIGFPVLIKASAGGGGRGMRLVKSANEFVAALHSARREALSAFADDTVLLEKYIERPRHVEVQIFGDEHGNVVHIFERDCSVQRRYQKLIEEAPAAHLDDAQRELIYTAAITAGRAAGYVGAGTVEFVIAADGAVYFIEMNTRLQVEHPVTEMITGADLVAWQINVANGGRLPSQDTISRQGHAIELRLCAEDPAREFAPATGTLTHVVFPTEVRVDHGIFQGATISPHYDSMIAKLIVHGADRAQAIGAAQNALARTEIAGTVTNRNYLAAILRHDRFAADNLDTHFVDTNQDELLAGTEPDGALLALAALSVIQARRSSSVTTSPWQLRSGFRLNLQHEEAIRFDDGNRVHELHITYLPDGFAVKHLDTVMHCTGVTFDGTCIAAQFDTHRQQARVVAFADTLDTFMSGNHQRFRVVDPLHDSIGEEAADGSLSAPMPGTVLDVFVSTGQEVRAGAPLMLLEAMKIEHTIAAPFDGVVTEIRFAPGDQISAEGVTLVAMEPIATT